MINHSDLELLATDSVTFCLSTSRILKDLLEFRASLEKVGLTHLNSARLLVRLAGIQKVQRKQINTTGQGKNYKDNQ